jgi:hypothetical protein
VAATTLGNTILAFIASLLSVLKSIAREKVCPEAFFYQKVLAWTALHFLRSVVRPNSTLTGAATALSERSGRTAFGAVRLDLLLHVMHHRYSSDQKDGSDDLVRVKAGMEESQVMQTAASVCIISR